MEAIAQSLWTGVLPESGMDESDAGLVLGLDFGSSNSSVSVWRGDKNKVKIIRNMSEQAAKVTPSLLQFNEGFKGFKIGSACDEHGAPVISGLKGILMGQNAGLERGEGWVDGVTLMCYDRPDGPDQKGKRFPVEELVGFMIGYLKDCAEEYLTRKPIKRINQIDGSVVETTTTYRPVDAAADNTDTTGTGEGKTGSQKGDTAPPAAAATQKPAQRVEITRVVLGIPANFTEQSKRCLKSAAHLAGFQEVHFLVESTAAAAAYGLAVAGRKTVLVVDMGGGTTDLSVVRVEDGVFTVRATGGNNSLGGNNIDAALLELVLRKAAALPERQREVVHGTKRSLLLKLCRQCKEALSSQNEAVICVPDPSAAPTTTVTPGAPAGGLEPSATIDIVVTLAEFEECISAVTDLVQATVRHTVQQYTASLRQAEQRRLQGLKQEREMEAVAAIDDTAKTVDGKSLSPSGRSNSPDLAMEDADGFVSITSRDKKAEKRTDTKKAGKKSDVSKADKKKTKGTAISSELTGTTAPGLSLQDQEKDSIVVQAEADAIQEVVLVGGSSRVPAVRAAIRRAFGDLGIARFSPDGEGELCTSLNPEEVVAEGLAIRGAVLSGVSSGKLRDLLVMDCLANSIGVMSWEGASKEGGGGGDRVRVFDAVLSKGAPLPATNKMRFQLASADQRFVSLDIYEETEECRIKPTSVTAEGGKNPPGGTQKEEGSLPPGQIETVYAYHVVATVDVPIPALEDRTATGMAGVTNDVYVTFTMTTEGTLKYEVSRIYDNTKTGNHGADGGRNTASEWSSYLLVLYGALMLVLYLFVKVTLVTPEVQG